MNNTILPHLRLENQCIGIVDSVLVGGSTGLSDQLVATGRRANHWLVYSCDTLDNWTEIAHDPAFYSFGGFMHDIA
jgi:hypothetical protein